MGLSKIVGQEKLKRVLMILLVSDSLKSLIISGKKGTGKSMAVREFGQTFKKKINTLPIGATPDMIYGSFSLDKFIKTGKKVSHIGLLEKSKDGIIYLDDINLFYHPLVKDLLDGIENGLISLERDGSSKNYEIKCKLIGTMNPEEGFLSATSLEKIDLYVEMEDIADFDLRKEIIRTYKNNKDREDEEATMLEKFNSAIRRINIVEIDDDTISLANEIYSEANCEGYRGLFNLINCAMVISAIDNQRKVGLNQLLEAFEYTIKHRKNELQEGPPKKQNEDNDNKEDEPEESNDDTENNEEEKNNSQVDNLVSEMKEDNKDKEEMEDGKNDDSDPISPNEIYAVKELTQSKRSRKKRDGSGKRIKVQTSKEKGRVIGTKMSKGEIKDINILETIKTAILFGAYDHEKRRLKVSSEHIRENRRKRRIGASIVFLVDASASMNANKRMQETKNAILSMLMDSYVRRDEVAMITFKGDSAEVVLDYTNSVIMAKRELYDLKTKGKTPLSLGMYKALELIKNKLKKNKYAFPIIILITDGRANFGSLFKDSPQADAKYVAELIKSEGIESVVIDTEDGFIKLGIPLEIAKAMDARYFALKDIKANKIEGIVRSITQNSISRVDIMED